jgi:hypothetical protein
LAIVYEVFQNLLRFPVQNATRDCHEKQHLHEAKDGVSLSGFGFVFSKVESNKG